MRARHVTLLVAGAVLAAAAVAAVASPGDPPEARGGRIRTWDARGFGEDPAVELDAPGPLWGMWPERGSMGRGRGGMWHGPDGRGLGGPEAGLLRGDGRLADQLKLTDAQRRKLREIGEGLARKAIQRRADVELARLDLARLIREDSSDRPRIEGQIDLLAKLRADQMKAAVRARLDAREVLTADQRKQLTERRTSRMPRRGVWR